MTALALLLLVAAEPEVKETHTSQGKLMSRQTYVRGVPHGHAMIANAFGGYDEGEYDHGLRIGLWHENNDKGQPVFETTYADGVKDGPELQYGDGDGRLKGQRVVVTRSTYSLGALNGTLEHFRNNGTLYYREHWVRGCRDGLHELFREDGTVQEQTQWRMGLTDKSRENAKPCEEKTPEPRCPKFIAPDGPDALVPAKLEALQRQFEDDARGRAHVRCMEGHFHEMRYCGKTLRCLPPELEHLEEQPPDRKIRIPHPVPTVGGVRG